MVQVIGILGFKGSGKDTAGEYLVREHGFVVESFANPLKDLIAAVFGWDRALLEGNTTDSRAWRESPDEWWEAKLDWNNSKGSYLGRFTPRVAMQYIGTDILRNHFDDSLWIKSLEYRLQGRDKVVITDCRFPNECKLIRQQGGALFRVKRGPEPVWYDVAVHAAMGIPDAIKHMAGEFNNIHISEWAWLCEQVDTIENDGTIADLYGKVAWLTKAHFTKS
jgi:hypothetical protein